MKVVDGKIDVGSGLINVSAERDPSNLPWNEVDIALECTGIFTDKEKASLHLKNGSKRVLVSAPSNGADKTVVFGVNHESLNSDHIIVSNASCTTNCLAPVAKVLQDNFGIKTGYMTTIHSYTGDQPSLDTMHNDHYRARAASLSMIQLLLVQQKLYRGLCQNLKVKWMVLQLEYLPLMFHVLI